MSLKDQLKAAMPTGPVPFVSAVAPAIAGLHIHRLTHEEGQKLLLACAKQDRATIERQVVGRTAVDADDKPVYDVPKDIGEIGQLGHAFIAEFVAESSRVNGLTDLDVQEVRKSFFANPANAGFTGSPGTSAKSTPATS